MSPAFFLTPFPVPFPVSQVKIWEGMGVGSTVHAMFEDEGKGKRVRHEVKVVAINSDRTICVRRVRARGWLFWGAWFLG